jgi:hypothetical protein
VPLYDPDKDGTRIARHTAAEGDLRILRSFRGGDRRRLIPHGLVTKLSLYASRAAQRSVVSVAVAVLDRQDTAAGVLVGALSLRTMSDVDSAIGSHDRTQLSVIARSAGAGVDRPPGIDAVRERRMELEIP